MQALVRESLPDADVSTAGTLSEGRRLLAEVEFQALLVDIELPDGDGLRFLGELRKDPKMSSIPTLILSGRTQISNKVAAFQFGAEDFIGKPFDPLELQARLMAKVKKRQIQEERGQTLHVGDVLIDLGRQKAFRLENQIENDLHLTVSELRILSLLTRRLEQVYSRDQILQHVWGDTFVSDRTVDSHIAHLRRKLEGTQLSVETIKGVGYSAAKK